MNTEPKLPKMKDKEPLDDKQAHDAFIALFASSANPIVFGPPGEPPVAQVLGITEQEAREAAWELIKTGYAQLFVLCDETDLPLAHFWQVRASPDLPWLPEPEPPPIASARRLWLITSPKAGKLRVAVKLN